MSTLENTHRAPAETPKNGLFRLIARLVASRYWPTRRCAHRDVTFPINNRQICLDCGASRRYAFDSDFEHADAGIDIGPWERPNRAQLQEAHRVVAGKLLDRALADADDLAARKAEPRPFPSNPTHCVDCGKALDAFGICPQADTRDVVRAHSPINCGKLAEFSRVFDSANRVYDRHVAEAAAQQ